MNPTVRPSPARQEWEAVGFHPPALFRLRHPEGDRSSIRSHTSLAFASKRPSVRLESVCTVALLLCSSSRAERRPTDRPERRNASIRPSIPIAPFPLPCPKVTPEIKTATSASSLSGVGAAQLEQVRQRSVTKYGPPSSCHSLSQVSAWSRLLRGSSALACPACRPAVPDRPATTALAYCHGPGLASRSSCSSSAVPCVGRRDRPGGRDTPVSFEHPGSCAQGEKLGSRRRAPRPQPPSLPSAQAWPRPSVGRPSSVCCLCLSGGSPPQGLFKFSAPCQRPGTFFVCFTLLIT